MWFVSTTLTDEEQKILEEGIEELFPSEEAIRKKRQFWKILVQTLRYFSVLIVLCVMVINGYFLFEQATGVDTYYILRCYNIVFCLIAVFRELELRCAVRHFRALGWPFSKFIFYTLIGFLSINDDVMESTGLEFWLQIGAITAMDMCAFQFLLMGICCAHNVRDALQTADDKALAPSEPAESVRDSKSGYGAIESNDSEGEPSWVHDDSDGPKNLSWNDEMHPKPPSWANEDLENKPPRSSSPHITESSPQTSRQEDPNKPSWLTESSEFQ